MQPLVPWGSFLPYHIARELAADPAAELLGRERRIPAVALFADVSGFTALSEALAAGHAGAEELTGILNAYFTPIIALIHSYGGIVGKFGGDSLTAFFPVEPDQRSLVPRRAVACALALQAHVRRYANLETSAGSFTLRMRVGLAEGPVYATVVGDPSARLEPILAGAVLDQAARAEAAAAPGEVVVPAALLPELGYALTELRAGTKGPDAFYAVTRTGDIPDPAPLAPLPPLGHDAVRRILAFLPPTIARRLDEGHARFVGEHRAVTALFVGFSGFDYDGDPELGPRLQRYLARLFEVVRRYDGYVNKIDMGDKGSKALILFGAPITHEDDAARALQCALELRDLDPALSPEPAAPSPRIGLASGFAFSGQVGSSSRQEYTVIGDAVNLAARLMQVAEAGTILADEATARDAVGAFEWGPPHELHVRGRSAPVLARPLLASRAAAQAADAPGRLIGRDDALAFLRERLGLALEGRGQVVTVAGPAGVGKSALAAAILDEAVTRGARRLGGECVSYRAASPYLVWRPIVRALLGLTPELDAADQAAQALAHLAAVDARLLPRASLLNGPAGLALPESELTLALDGEARKAATEALVGDLVAAAALVAPLVIALESCQWIDPLSRDLLLALARRCAGLPALMMLAFRSAPEAREAWATPLRTAQLAHLGELRLADLDADAAAELVAHLCRLHGQAAPAEEFVGRILARTQGNPLFIVELLGMLRERGLDVAAAPPDLELPDSLHRLVLSRIDRLDEHARTVLKVASVVGHEFSPSWLAGIYPALGDGLDRPLEELRRAELAVLGHNGNEPAYLFRHVITREVAYESLSTVLRADLHGRVGGFIERTFADDLEPFLDLLAHHYSHSDNRAKQREYLLRAGVAAQAAFANEAAVSFFERLLPLLPDHDRSEVMLRLGQVLRHMGHWDEADTQFRGALRLANDRITAARCRLEQGELLRRRGDPAAGEWLAAARHAFLTAGHAAGAGEAERLLGLVALAQGDYARALASFEDAIRPLSGGGDPNRMSLLLVNLGAVFYTDGDMARALDCFERSLSLAAQTGNRQRIGVAVGNLGAIYHTRGDFCRAHDYYTQKLQCALEIGDRLEMSISLGNLGHIYEDQGEYPRATGCYLRSLELALDMGERTGVGMALLGLANVALAEDDLAQAELLVGRAEAVFASIAATYELADCRLMRADLAVRCSTYALARTLLLEACELAEESGNDVAAHSVAILSLEVDRLRGALADDAAVDTLRALLDGHESDDRRAELLYAIVRADGTQAAARAAAAGIYRALHMHTPRAAYRRAYTRLMGVALPLPAPLPAPPTALGRRLPHRETLLERADAFIAALQLEFFAERAAGAGR